MSIKSLLSAIAFSVFALSSASAAVITIGTSKDATIGGGYNNAGNTWYRWVSNNGYFAIFGFDTSSLVGKTINSVNFSAYHNYAGGDATIGAALGTDSTWDAGTVVSYASVGAVLDTQTASGASVNGYQTWNLGALAIADSQMTVALVALTNGWNDYEPLSYGGAHAAYLTVDVSDNTVPEPASLGLLGLAMAGLGLARRRKAA